ncbi:MAG: CoA pyrophosphatase [Pirellulaceae bacterium]
MAMDVWSDPNLDERLRRQIDRGFDDLDKSSFSPALAYGRHRGPAAGLARQSLRHAAVLIALMRCEGQWMIPLTLRPMTLSHHGGQICLPGGQIEPHETPMEAALREFHEELGVAAHVRMHCGQLRNQYVFGSDNRVHPMVATIDSPDTEWRPDPVEVDQVILLPLRILLNADSHTTLKRSKPVRQDGTVVDQLVYSAPAIEYDNHVIWGATAMILEELAQILHS